jgi:transcriptional regulator with XRE-family HTH domain
MALFRFDGTELKNQRLAAGFTQAELARQVGRCKASLTHYESGHTVPPTAALLRLASALGCEPGALFSPEPGQEDVHQAVMT